MRDPLQRLKFLPWVRLCLSAIVTALVAALLEFLVLLAAQVTGVGDLVLLLFASPLAPITRLALAAGLGAFAVFWLERVHPEVRIQSGVLWALVLCVLVAIGLKGGLPLPLNLLPFNELLLIGIVVGVFWKGRRYWR